MTSNLGGKCPKRIIQKKLKKMLKLKMKGLKKMNHPSKLLMEIEDDRISKLADEILHHILSKIDIKQAVGTSILSKRWKSLWHTLPYLSFDFTRLAYKSGLAFSGESFMSRFTDLVTQFLSRRDNISRIRKFKLCSNTAATDSTFVENCLDYAISHGVEHLNIDAFCIPTRLKLPDALFASTTLRALKLRQYPNSVVIPKPFVLPNLDTLYLEGFTFLDDDADDYSFPKEPFSCFPNLKKLTLNGCEVSGLIISASKLRVLKISFFGMLFSRETTIEEISTPMLSSFSYEGYVSLVCLKMEFPCLEEVYFDICYHLESPYTDEIEKKLPQNTVRMLQQLGTAKFVALTLDTIRVLEMDLHLLEHTPSPFPHIKLLKLTKRPWVIYLANKVGPTVVNYLTKGSSYGDNLRLKFTEGVIPEDIDWLQLI